MQKIQPGQFREERICARRMKEKERRHKSFIMYIWMTTETGAAAAGTITDNIYHLHNGRTQMGKFGKL